MNPADLADGDGPMSDTRHGNGASGRPPTGESQLVELRAREERLTALRARRVDLEVERIVAATELGAVRAGSASDIPGALAGAVVDALDRLRRLESAHAAHAALIDTGARSHEELLERLRAGDDALGGWLGADREDAGAGGRRIAKQVLLVVCLAIVVLALAVHLAFLVLLVPVGGAMSFVLWSGQDRAWRRMGARRRYESLRLEVPAAWTEDAVHERRRALARIAERVRERASAPDDEDDEDDKVEQARLSADIDSARSDLREAVAAAGFASDGIAGGGSVPDGSTGSGLDEATEARMRALARAWRAGQALQGVVKDMAGERVGAGEIRESIYRALARKGEASPDGDASVDALEAGVERSSRR